MYKLHLLFLIRSLISQLADSSESSICLMSVSLESEGEYLCEVSLAQYPALLTSTQAVWLRVIGQCLQSPVNTDNKLGSMFSSTPGTKPPPSP